MFYRAEKFSSVTCCEKLARVLSIYYRLWVCIVGRDVDATEAQASSFLVHQGAAYVYKFALQTFVGRISVHSFRDY